MMCSLLDDELRLASYFITQNVNDMSNRMNRIKAGEISTNWLERTFHEHLLTLIELCHTRFTSRISLCIRKETKQVYNKSHYIQDFVLKKPYICIM